MFKRTLLLVALAVFAGPTNWAHAGGKNVAIIDYSDLEPWGQGWCYLLTNNGHTCTVFPHDGPTGPLDPFDVVIDLSLDWSDPTGMLADCMRAGKTVITWSLAPYALGVQTNPAVEAWIGASWDLHANGRLTTTALDPILGNVRVGTELDNCGASLCAMLTDAPGHPFAKVLARFTDWPYPQPPPPPIGIMRNYWEGGVSVYLTDLITPGSSRTSWIILNAVEARNTIPTLNTWGLLALALGIGAAGTIVLRRRQSLTRSRATPLALLGACLLAASGPLQADVTTNQENGVTFLRIGVGDPFHSTGPRDSHLFSSPDHCETLRRPITREVLCIGRHHAPGQGEPGDLRKKGFSQTNPFPPRTRPKTRVARSEMASFDQKIGRKSVRRDRRARAGTLSPLVHE